jgi:2-polyprenyl-3-methyl-5-hydroxy-6-metoxy-1,4-benzoquinol methylase
MNGVIQMKISDWPEWHCPVHRSGLKDEGDFLVCPVGERFPLRNSIPRFVARSNYADPFGAQWKKYRLTQLDSYTRTTISKDRARRCLGEELWTELAGKQVLECGCGAGRFTEVLLDEGAYVTSIDLSDAVDANQENFPQDATHRVAQADIQQLPFAPQQFDIVFCLGVIQHTPNPEKTITCLYDQVRAGGTMVIDHCTHSLSLYTKSATLFRYFLSHLSPEEGMTRTEWLVDRLLPLHRMARHFYPAQMLLSRLSPVLCYYHTYPQFSDNLQREWALLDTYDSLMAWYSHVRSRGQIRRLLERLGLQDTWCHCGGNGVEARGKRPLASGADVKA